MREEQMGEKIRVCGKGRRRREGGRARRKKGRVSMKRGGQRGGRESMKRGGQRGGRESMKRGGQRGGRVSMKERGQVPGLYVRRGCTSSNVSWIPIAPSPVSSRTRARIKH